jgi:hypothetical protein
MLAGEHGQQDASGDERAYARGDLGGPSGMTTPRSFSSAPMPIRATLREGMYMNFGIASAVSSTPAAVRNSVRNGAGAQDRDGDAGARKLLAQPFAVEDR